MTARNLIAVLAVAFWAAGMPAAGQEAGGLGRLVEMPAHRALMARIAAGDARLAPFVTDGCSGGLSASWAVAAEKVPGFAELSGKTPPWEGCCVIHDHAYHDAGGATTPEQSFAERLRADKALRACVAGTAEEWRDELAARYDVSPATITAVFEAVADAMYLAVRLGGGPCTGLPWRWGFGYPGCNTAPAAGETAPE